MLDIRNMTRAEAARAMDCLLVPYDTWDRAQFATSMETALRCAFGGIYVLPNALEWVRDQYGKELHEKRILLCSGIGEAGLPALEKMYGFKLLHTEALLKRGADCLDYLINIAAAIAGDYDVVRQEIRGVVSLCHGAGAQLRVVLACDFLEEAAIRRVSAIAAEAGADGVKTNADAGTAFGRPSLFDLLAIREALDEVGADCALIAGNITFPTTGYCLLQAGADRMCVTAGAEEGARILGYLERVQQLLTAV